MATVQIQGSDGKTYTVNAPEGTDESKLKRAVEEEIAFQNEMQEISKLEKQQAEEHEWEQVMQEGKQAMQEWEQAMAKWKEAIKKVGIQEWE